MKRFASHYLYLPGYGFLKQYVIEVKSSGEINRFFPLIDEMASIEWMPGVLIVSSDSTIKENCFDISDILEELPGNFLSEITGKKILLFRIYPFDFVNMKPINRGMVSLTI